jgi:CheY-like chemotaxis protein
MKQKGFLSVFYQTEQMQDVAEPLRLFLNLCLTADRQIFLFGCKFLQNSSPSRCQLCGNTAGQGVNMSVQPFPSEFPIATPGNYSKLILSVDDEPNILHTRQAILEAEGYAVLSAIDAEDALELFDAHPVIQLVLLDYAMPGMDGLTLAREIKKRRPRVPIFMVSAHEDTLSKMNVDCVELVIPKGSGPEFLLERIKQGLTPASAPAVPRSIENTMALLTVLLSRLLKGTLAE